MEIPKVQKETTMKFSKHIPIHHIQASIRKHLGSENKKSIQRTHFQLFENDASFFTISLVCF